MNMQTTQKPAQRPKEPRYSQVFVETDNPAASDYAFEALNVSGKAPVYEAWLAVIHDPAGEALDKIARALPHGHEMGQKIIYGLTIGAPRMAAGALTHAINHATAERVTEFKRALRTAGLRVSTAKTSRALACLALDHLADVMEREGVVLPPETTEEITEETTEETTEEETETMAPVTTQKPAPAPALANGAAQQLQSAIADAIGGTLQAMLAAQPANIDEAKIIELIREHAVKRTVIESAQRPEPVDCGVQHHQFETLLKAVAARVNCYLPGPAGSGKSRAAREAAKALDLPYYSHGSISAAHELLGFIDGNGTYHRTAFREAFEFGGVFCADELDGSIPSEALSVNNHIAAAAGDLMPFPDGMIERHPDFVVVATANTVGSGRSREYVGRYQLDAATLNRFAILSWEYDEQLERSIAGNDKWTATVQAFRDAVKRCEIRHVVSPRDSIHGAKLLAAGLERADVVDMLLWRGLEENDRQRIRAAYDSKKGGAL